MNSQLNNRNGNNDFNRNRNILNDDVIELNRDGMSSNIDKTNKYLGGSMEISPNTVSNNNHQTQTIKINGILYAPIQQVGNSNDKGLNRRMNNFNRQPYPLKELMSQPLANQSNSPFENPLKTPSSHYHLQEKQNSTPKRGNEQLNRSNEQKKKPKHDASINQQYLQSHTTSGPNNRTNLNNKQLNIPIDQLKRAVGNNLPCFVIKFDSDLAPRELPSAIIAADLLKEHFHNSNINIEKFSVAIFAGNQLKLGVDNMEDYATLARTDKWPNTINRKRIEVVKPKFVPECFTLVIRYVPLEIPIGIVTEQIQRSIKSADNFKQIKYSYNRTSNDFRFTVADLNEYEGALNLGRLSIMNRLHPVTKYLPANKLTVCTNCWKVGHVRSACRSNTRKCRICLETFNQEHTAKCSGQPRCAQCGLNHHSLDPSCEQIQSYRQTLNRDVKLAVENGTINRKIIPIHQQILEQPPRFNEDAEFPVLINENFATRTSENKEWPFNRRQSSLNNGTQMNVSVSNMLKKMDRELKHEINELKNMIGKNLYEKIGINTGNIQLQQEWLSSINSTITKMIQEVLIPLTVLIPNKHQMVKNQITSVLQDMETTVNCHAEYIRKSFIFEQTTNQPFSKTPSSLSTRTEEKKIIDMSNQQRSSAPSTSTTITPSGNEEEMDDSHH